jgi:hypothetical protein
MFAKDNCAVQDTHKMQLILPPMLPYFFCKVRQGLTPRVEIASDEVGESSPPLATSHDGSSFDMLDFDGFHTSFPFFSINHKSLQILSHRYFSLNLPRSVTSALFIIEIK